MCPEGVILDFPSFPRNAWLPSRGIHKEGQAEMHIEQYVEFRPFLLSLLSSLWFAICDRKEPQGGQEGQEEKRNERHVVISPFENFSREVAPKAGTG